ERLVAHGLAGLRWLHVRVRPQVAAANAGAGDAEDRVGRVDDGRLGHVLDADVPGGVHDGGAHQAVTAASLSWRVLISFMASPPKHRSSEGGSPCERDPGRVTYACASGGRLERWTPAERSATSSARAGPSSHPTRSACPTTAPAACPACAGRRSRCWPAPA